MQGRWLVDTSMSFALDIPVVLLTIGMANPNPLDVRKLTQLDASAGIRLQGDIMIALEILVFELDHDRTVDQRFSVPSEDIEDIESTGAT